MQGRLYILGKSTYAISIIFDIIKLHKWDLDMYIVTNIPEEENSSRGFEYENGIEYREITLSDFQPTQNDEFVIGSIGKSRMKIKEFFENQFGVRSRQYRNIIHPTAIIADTVEMGKGIQIGPLSVVAPYSQLKDHCTINRSVSVGHHTVLESFACLNPGVTVSGLCSIGTNTMIGSGATVLDQIQIGARTIIGAGAIVTKNIEAGVVAYGSPAKVKRQIK